MKTAFQRSSLSVCLLLKKNERPTSSTQSPQESGSPAGCCLALDPSEHPHRKTDCKAPKHRRWKTSMPRKTQPHTTARSLAASATVWMSASAIWLLPKVPREEWTWVHTIQTTKIPGVCPSVFVDFNVIHKTALSSSYRRIDSVSVAARPSSVPGFLRVLPIGLHKHKLKLLGES